MTTQAGSQAVRRANALLTLVVGSGVPRTLIIALGDLLITEIRGLSAQLGHHLGKEGS